MILDLKKCGLTPKRIELLSKLGINTSLDLINYYPFRYEKLEYKDPGLWEVNDQVVVNGTLLTRPTTFRFQKNKSITRFTVLIGDIEYNISIFNRPWASNLSLGQEVTIIGKYQGNFKILATTYNGKSLKDNIGITPVYSTSEKVNQKIIRESIKKVFLYLENEIEDDIPNFYKNKYRLLDKRAALKFLHFPSSDNEINMALRTLKYEEFLKFFIANNLMKMANTGISKNKKSFDFDQVFTLANNLKFKLTKDQVTSVNEILNDMSSNKIMYRLLQGDVGSGKTLVAALALFASYLSKSQGALMAPTEILAKQHYISLKDLFKPFNVKVDVLYSSLPSIKKKEVLERLKNGEIDILVGTHSIIQEGVIFKNLGLVIADEQHRFGVGQRKKLKDKGDKVDFLLMSATPIPRTMAISLYGDMDISTIETMPEGRKPVITHLIKENSFRSVKNSIDEKLEKNEQVYIICAAIEESDTLHTRSVEKVYEAISKAFASKYGVGFLHGKMSSQEKDEIMDKFLKNKIQILISTTVIEVGVNVANASVMIIYDSDRFGLSQLHQLRGRIQRGNKQGICYLLTNSKDKETLKRLEVLVNSNNGFDISSEDLRLRGPGDILGTRQSGLPAFVLGDLFKDTNIINQARIDAKEIIENTNLENKRLVDIIKKLNETNIQFID